MDLFPPAFNSLIISDLILHSSLFHVVVANLPLDGALTLISSPLQQKQLGLCYFTLSDMTIWESNDTTYLYACCCNVVMLFGPHALNQHNRTVFPLTDEAEHVIRCRMSNKSLDMEPVLLFRQTAPAAWTSETHTRRD